MDNDEITLGELYRRLDDMEGRQGQQLTRIEEQVRKTNGTVIEHGQRIGVLEREAKSNREAAKEHKAVSTGDAYIGIRVSKRMATILGSGGAALTMFWPQIKAAILALLGASGN